MINLIPEAIVSTTGGQMKHQAISAQTKETNNEETDKQPRVWHKVSVLLSDENGDRHVTTLHYSSDPLTAILEINMMPTEQFISRLYEF